MTTDWRALFGRYMLAAENYTDDAGDAPWLLEGEVSKEEREELLRLHEEVFRKPYGTARIDDQITIHLGDLVPITVAVLGRDLCAGDQVVESVSTEPGSILDVELAGTEPGRQAILLTAERTGEGTVFVRHPCGITSAFRVEVVEPRKD